ncbi:MAG TPA: LEA type 2 family protein [Gemmatimonadales bacterium]|nr:LEA type 2 family protein [Gemmatimonadales bacterium]
MTAGAGRHLVWALIAAGCTPLGLWVYDDPVVTVSRITLAVGGATPSPSPVVVALDLNNVNDYPISTERVELSLRLDGIPIGQLQRDSTIEVATDTVSTLAVPLALERHATGERLRALGSGTHKFDVRGRATFRTPFGIRKVRFAQEGSLVFGARGDG